MQMSAGLALDISHPSHRVRREPVAISNSAVFPPHHRPVACCSSFPPHHLFFFHRKHLVWYYFVLRCSCQDDPHEQALMADPYEDIFSLNKALLETVILHLVGFSCRFAISSSESRLAESAQGAAFPKRERTYLHRKPIQFLIYITYLHRYFHIGQARVLLRHAFTSHTHTHEALNECSEG